MEASVASQADLRSTPAEITYEGSTSVTRGTPQWLPGVFLLSVFMLYAALAFGLYMLFAFLL